MIPAERMGVATMDGITRRKLWSSIIVGAFTFLLVFSGITRGDTYRVPVDYDTIQEAIDGVASQGDTVVVDTGRYVENIDYHGKDIFLTSLYYLAGDESYIRQTILDGGQNGAVITFQEGESRAAVLNGFTVTNGSGHETAFVGTVGGGVYVRESSPSVMNSIVESNRCCGSLLGGGGLYCYLSSACLSNVVIRGNVACNMGGGLYINSSDVELDSVNRCSIYDNWAGAYNDIFQPPIGDFHPVIYLDTASVAILDDYFIGGDFAVVDILNSSVALVQYDLWVSPDGDNDNSGATYNDPLKSIAYAFQIIQADSLNPRIIHLLPGVFTPSEIQIFPINLRSYVSLIGSGRDSTILDMAYECPRVLCGMNEEINCAIQSISFTRVGREVGVSGLRFMQNRNLVLEDLFLYSNNARWLFGSGLYEWMEYKSGTSITLRNCTFIDNHCIKVLSVGNHLTALVSECRFEQTTPLEDPDYYGMASALGMVGYSPAICPYPYHHRVENCTFLNNENYYTENYTFSSALNVDDYYHPIDIVNCTFADNCSPVSGGIRISSGVPGMQVRVANCLFWGNEPNQIYHNGVLPPSDPATELWLSHNLIQDLEGGIEITGNAEAFLAEGNFSENPLFVGEGDTPYALSAESPAIDAGTAFWVVDGDTVVNLTPDQYHGAAPDIGAYEFAPDAVLEELEMNVPEGFGITSIYPNPFNSSTRISFQLEQSGSVELLLYAMTGREVKKLMDAWVCAGEHSVVYKADDLASGVYVVRLDTHAGYSSRKLTLAK